MLETIVLSIIIKSVAPILTESIKNKIAHCNRQTVKQLWCTTHTTLKKIKGNGFLILIHLLYWKCYFLVSLKATYCIYTVYMHLQFHHYFYFLRNFQHCFKTGRKKGIEQSVVPLTNVSFFFNSILLSVLRWRYYWRKLKEKVVRN